MADNPSNEHIEQESELDQNWQSETVEDTGDEVVVNADETMEKSNEPDEEKEEVNRAVLGFLNRLADELQTLPEEEKSKLIQNLFGKLAIDQPEELLQVEHIEPTLGSGAASSDKTNSSSDLTDEKIVQLINEVLNKRVQQDVAQTVTADQVQASTEGKITAVNSISHLVNGLESVTMTTIKSLTEQLKRSQKQTQENNMAADMADMTRQPDSGVPSNVQYRMSTLKQAETEYIENMNLLWRDNKLSAVRNKIEMVVTERGIAVEEMMSKINNDPSVAELSTAFNEALANSPDAQEKKEKMDVAFDSWIKTHERLSDDFRELDPENEEMKKQFSEYSESAENMLEAARQVPKVIGMVQSHLEKLQEYFEEIKEKIKELMSSVKNLLGSITGNGNKEDNGPSI